MPVAQLSNRALISVTGPDARSYLHNLLTQDIETLAEGQLRFGALLSAPGRLLFDLFILGQSDGVLLDVAAVDRDALIQRLSLYRLRAKVEIAPDDRPVFAAWPGQAAGFLADPRTPLMGGRAYGAGTADADLADYDAYRLSVGLPDPHADVLKDKTYPIEADFDLLNGIDFKKGCFVGQETTSRMKRRGTIKNRMLPLEFEGPPPAFGSEVLKGELRAGEVLSGRDGSAMALLRLDRLDGDLTVDGRSIAEQIVLITGAARGVGAASARAFAAQGARVIINWRTSQDAAQALASEIGEQAVALQADVAGRQAVEEMVAKAHAHFGASVTTVVNNALDYSFNGDARSQMESIEWSELDRQFSTVVKGALNLIQATTPAMAQARFGRIINIGTNLFQNPVVPYHDYTAAKAALLSLTRTACADLGPDGVTVNMVSGGLLRTTDA
ncbi:hypothetical protein LTR94_026377, partial [Friedmanniomyces endolithicus]